MSCPRPTTCCNNFTACNSDPCTDQPAQFIAAINDFDAEYIVGTGVTFSVCLLAKCCDGAALVYDQLTPEDFFTLPLLAVTIPAGDILALDANDVPILGTANFDMSGCQKFLITEDFLSSLGLLSIGTDVNLASQAVLRFSATVCGKQSIADVSLSLPILQA